MTAPLPRDVTSPAITADESDALFASLIQDKRLLVAVSGGPDSVALLVLLRDWVARQTGPVLHAATVDHALRRDSAEEAAAVAALCERLDVPHATLIWEEPKPASGIQQRARAARYALLANEAARLGGAVVVTAHTQDDQAETVLMRIAQGSGPVGLASMKARTRKDAIEVARPLLGIAKARLIATLEARGVPFARDPSNGDARFERVRWRALMPALAGEGMSAPRLAALAGRLARLNDVAERRLAEILPGSIARDGGEVRVRLALIAAEPDEIVLRVLSHALSLAGHAAEEAQPPRLERLEACLLALQAALRRSETLTRTLSGSILTLGRDGTLTLSREPPRRRGIHPAP